MKTICALLIAAATLALSSCEGVSVTVPIPPDYGGGTITITPSK